jgi:hypothetical protein
MFFVQKLLVLELIEEDLAQMRRVWELKGVGLNLLTILHPQLV